MSALKLCLLRAPFTELHFPAYASVPSLVEAEIELEAVVFIVSTQEPPSVAFVAVVVANQRLKTASQPCAT